ncbi:hypothetical protein ACOMHN_043057 [Nucella lapillus]
MAKKKQEIQLMREIESQEEWEDIMGREGLWVVDVYQEWSGHCNAMVSNFRRIKNELGDDFLHFAMAKSDTIESLDKYRGSCEPCFLFFAGGVLVSYVHGANSPQVLRTLTEQLSQEHKVMEGNTERKEVKDPFVANRESADDAQRDDDDDDEDAGGRFQYNGELVMYGDDLTPADRFEEVEEGYTVAIIKPNAVAEGKVDEILAEMQARGIDVIAQEERQLTEEEAREFYVHLKDEDYFENLVSFMTSGPSHMLVLTKGQEDDSVIKDWRDMLGPPTVEDAKEKAPESLRAKYGQAGLMNALHGSDSKETAAREMAFFFPHMQIPTIQKKKKTVERTLALIRPDAFASNRDAILERIKEAGFQIALQKEVTLTKEQAEDFYKEHAGQHYYEELTARMSSGPLLALGLAREDAVQNWRGMLGPTNVEEAKAEAPDSLRAQFAVDDAPVNQLHGSDDPKTAQKEIQFFFPIEQTVAMITPDAIGTKDAIIDKIHQAGFRIAARKETVITREIAESIYEDQKDKEYFNDLVEQMISGPTVFMVLSGEGAVEGWRQEIGPTDPAQAKETAPDSLRAQFGTDLLNNAVHGCSSAEEAQQKIHMMFGDLEFNPDGTVKGEVAQKPEEQAEQEQQAEQQQQQAEQQQQEAAAEQPQAKQPAEGKAEEQEAQQAEQPAGAEGQTEEAGQSEEKPAEGEEAAEKTEGQVEEKLSETAADSAEKDQRPSTAEKDQRPSTAEKDESAGAAEKDEKAGTAEKDESAEKTEGEVEEKPTESSAGKEADKEAAGQAAQQKASEEQDSTQQDTTQQDTTQQDTTQQDSTQQDTTQQDSTQQDTTQQDTTQQDTTQQDTTQQDTTQQDTTQQDSTPSQDKKPEEATTQQAEGAKAEEPAAAEQPAQEAKTEESPKDNTPAAEESKDTKAEEQKDQTEGQKEEEGKGEQKEGTAEAKKEVDEEKKEA